MPTGTGDWFDKMAAAVRKREIALNGVERWTKKVTEAEAKIQELTAERDAPETLPAPEALQDEAAELSADLRPVFGASNQFNVSTPADAHVS